MKHPWFVSLSCPLFLSHRKILVPFVQRQNLWFSNGHALSDTVATSYLNKWLSEFKLIWKILFLTLSRSIPSVRRPHGAGGCLGTGQVWHNLLTVEGSIRQSSESSPRLSAPLNPRMCRSPSFSSSFSILPPICIPSSCLQKCSSNTNQTKTPTFFSWPWKLLTRPFYLFPLFSSKFLRSVVCPTSSISWPLTPSFLTCRLAPINILLLKMCPQGHQWPSFCHPHPGLILFYLSVIKAIGHMVPCSSCLARFLMFILSFLFPMTRPLGEPSRQLTSVLTLL